MENVQYRHIERALQMLHMIPDGGLPAFRARLRHFRALGVPDLPKTGSGKKIDYSSEHIYQLFLALELAEFDIAPATVAAIVADNWLALHKSILQARRKNSVEQYLAFVPQFLSEAWPEKIAAGLALYSHAELLRHMISDPVDARWSPESISNPGVVVIHLTKRVLKIDYYVELARDRLI